MKLFRDTPQAIIVVGAHAPIIQSVLDFDYMRGAVAPSITAIIGGTKKTHKCWFGDQEILLPVYQSIDHVKNAGVSAQWLLNIASANSARKITESFFAHYPDAHGAHLFAENLAEQDALALVESFGEDKLIAGASGVGLLIPGAMKLGAIGGIFGGNTHQLARCTGNTAIICSSGGMVNEIIDSVLRAKGMPSFAVSYGGDQFPVSAPLTWCLQAEADAQTEQIVLFGELGGYDEYDIAQAIKEKRITKPLYAYIAGHYQTPGEQVQFGHAKALAKNPEEDAAAKTAALAAAGATVFDTYAELIAHIQTLPHTSTELTAARTWVSPETFRRPSLFTAKRDLGRGSDAFVRHALCTLLETEQVSDVLVECTELVYSILIDHGAQVSGAVNTMVTARAGKDMAASLASGILTVGDRFGGAINAAAQNWFASVQANVAVEDMLEAYKGRGEYVHGIGHLKYSIHQPDPRVEQLLSFAEQHLPTAKHVQYAQSVARRTTQKRSNLILNVDGAVAAIVLDILIEHEQYSVEQIEELFRIEFFNSYFLIPRTVGFVGNYLSQKRRDEGLFRLPDDQIFYE